MKFRSKKMRHIIFVIICILAIACKKNPESVLSDNEIINSWIEETMNHYYLWNDQVNIPANTNKDVPPEEYFKKIIVANDNYSEITKNLNRIISERDAIKAYPIFLDTVYNTENKNIAYLVYDAFHPDNGDLSKQYDLQLNSIFKTFKSKNVTELILDLRRNTGGHISSSANLASMVVKNLNQNNIYAKYVPNKQYEREMVNEKGADCLNIYFNNKIQDVEINNLNLNRLIVITSPASKSVVEIFINSLKPYMEVVIVGSKTAGKNVNTSLFYEDNPRSQTVNNYAIILATMKVANKAGNTEYGFEPNITESADNALPLGNINEKLLSAAINYSIKN